MLNSYALEQDIRRRIRTVQSVMQAQGVGVLLLSAQGAPGMMGVARYFTNLQLWAGSAWVVLGSEEAEAALVVESSYEAEWNRQAAATAWVECPAADALGRAIEIVRDLRGSGKKIGVVHPAKTWNYGDWMRIQNEFSGGMETVELGQEIDDLRAVKSSFEIEEIYRTGCVLTAAMERFSAAARPGVRCWEAAAAAEQVIKSQGGFHGRTKFSFNLRPETIPTPLDRLFSEDDIFVFEIVYPGPYGYWYEMSLLFSFKNLPQEQERQLRAHEKVIQSCSAAMKAGTKIGGMHAVASQVWREEGFEVIGAHTPNCHSIGLDGVDGPSSWSTPDVVLKPNMVLSFHPSSLLEGERAYLLSDNYLVTPEGCVPLSPRQWFYRRLE